jgi:hypothetical protein
MKRFLIAVFLCFLFILASHQAVFASSNMEIELKSSDGTEFHCIAWTVGDQCAYILTDQGIYAYYDGVTSLRFFAPIYGIASNETQLKDNASLYISSLAFNNGQLYGINTWAGTCIRIAENTLPVSTDVICTVDLTAIFPDSDSLPLDVRGIILSDTALYMLVDNSKNISKSNLIGWNLKNGKVLYNEELEYVQNMVPYNTDQAIGISCDQNKSTEKAFYGIVDLKKGTFQKLGELPSRQSGGLCFDSTANKLYIVSTNLLYRCELGEPWEKLNYLSGPMILLGAQGGIVNQNYLFCGYDQLYIRDTAFQMESTAALTIAGGSNEPSFLKAANNLGGIPLVYTDNTQSINQVLTNLLTGDTDVDIYIVSTGQYSAPMVNAILEKGYALDLSGNAEISQFVYGMPSSLQKQIVHDGKIYALPLYVSGTTYGYIVHEDVMADAGLTNEDMPENWLDLLDFIIDWCDTKALDHSEIVPFRMYDEYYEAYSMILRYSDLYISQNEYPDFDTPLFRDLMGKLRIAIKAMDDAELLFPKTDNENIMDAFLMRPTIIESMASTSLRLGNNIETESRLIKYYPVGPEVQNCFPVIMRLLIVNPRSKNVDLAAQFAAQCLREMNELDYMALYTDALHTVPDPDYEKNRNNRLEEIQSIETKKKAAIDNISKDDEEILEWAKKWLSNDNLHKYIVSEGDIEVYREQAARAFVPMFDMQSLDNFTDIVRQYTDRQIDLDTLIQKLSNIMNMYELENGGK